MRAEKSLTCVGLQDRRNGEALVTIPQGTEAWLACKQTNKKHDCLLLTNRDLLYIINQLRNMAL